MVFTLVCSMKYLLIKKIKIKDVFGKGSCLQDLFIAQEIFGLAIGHKSKAIWDSVLEKME